ncbi:RNA polymerase sigma factor [Telluribacter sp. SYSU D00476]|uniref:RNA polymerase sigma factor n=1 Tax=Telluribacter sp. SYSU D00476 TaxID=2811430 RepID=UPI001FF5204D|nr:sigma-70 family RNA polymerase sigma factor [Telluribacter sp. SYSU D00476]
MATKLFSYSESELIASLQRNERHAFEYLYDHYSGCLYSIICKIIRDETRAEDAMQETFLKIWKSIKSYNSEKGSLFTWMLNIARNTAIDALRVDSKRGNLYDGLDSTLVQMAMYQPITYTFDLQDLVERLRPERKLLVDLVYFQGYTHEEVSEKLSLPLGTIKSRIRTALQELRVVFGVQY